MFVAIAIILLSLSYLIQLITVNIQSVIKVAPDYQQNLEALFFKAYSVFREGEVPNIREFRKQLDIGAYLQSFGATVRALVSSMGIITVYLIFLLLEQRTFGDKIKAIMRPETPRGHLRNH